MIDDVPPPPQAAPDEALSLLQALRALLADLPGVVTDRVHLLALELRRASGALGQMVVLGLFASILVATAWLAFWVGVGGAVIAAGLAWPWAVLLILLVNLGGAAWALVRVKALAPLLALPATLRRLTDSDAPERDEARRDDETARDGRQSP